jgi:hypothetical protein
VLVFLIAAFIAWVVIKQQKAKRRKQRWNKRV